jgi:hypothetical protein
MPADYLKSSGSKLPDLYDQALKSEERIAALLKNATRENKFATTKDWSFTAEYHCGENWILSGESSGFADPILSAGLNISQAAAREVAFTVLELIRGKEDPAWLRDAYNRRTEKRVVNHIRFADFWYTSNAQFEDLQKHTQEIAKDNNLDLTPEASWAWIAQGGFIDEDLNTGTGGFTISAVKSLSEFLGDVPLDNVVHTNNVFKLNLEGAELRSRANYFEGKVLRDDCYYRGEKVLPTADAFQVWLDILKECSTLPEINKRVAELNRKYGSDPVFRTSVGTRLVSTLEAMVRDGWVEASRDANIPLPPAPKTHPSVHAHVPQGTEHDPGN